MKRSEMLALLDKEINRRCDYGTVFFDKDIEEILNIIEQAGMQPPLVHPIHHYRLDMIQALDKEYRKWEPEDGE